MNQTANVVRSIDETAALFSKILTLKITKETPYVIMVKPFKNSRSLAQNSLLHMWIAIIADETGNDNETVKNELKRLFLGSEMMEWKNPKTGDKRLIAVLKSTAKLSMKEMSEFMNKVQAWANTDMGIRLPQPEDLYWSIQ